MRGAHPAKHRKLAPAITVASQSRDLIAVESGDLAGVMVDEAK